MASLKDEFKLPRETRRDAARLGLQSAAAAGATYALMKLAGLPELSWAVISALFVVQQSPDSTLKSAGGRLLGTVIGTAVGLAAVELIPYTLFGGYGILTRLVISGLLVNALAAPWPGLRFGVVAAAIIALEPSEQNAIAGAIDRGIAILAGSVVGATAALAVWPDPAYRRLRRHVRQALSACADLLDAALGDLRDGGGGRCDLEPYHARILAELEQAHAAAGASRLHRWPGLKRGTEPRRLVHATERLWHALVMIDRVDRDARYRLDPGLSDHAAEAIGQVRAAACRHLGAVIGAMEKWEPPPEPADLRDALKTAEDALRTPPREADRPAAIRAHAIQFALSELCKNAEELTRALRRDPAGREGTA